MNIPAPLATFARHAATVAATAAVGRYVSLGVSPLDVTWAQVRDILDVAGSAEVSMLALYLTPLTRAYGVGAAPTVDLAGIVPGVRHAQDAPEPTPPAASLAAVA